MIPDTISSSGMFIIAAGLFLLSLLNEKSSIINIVLYLAIIGLGVGMFQTPNNCAIMNSVSQEQKRHRFFDACNDEKSRNGFWSIFIRQSFQLQGNLFDKIIYPKEFKRRRIKYTGLYRSNEIYLCYRCTISRFCSYYIPDKRLFQTRHGRYFLN